MVERRRKRTLPDNDPLWYKDAVIYELRVGAFQDSDDDGVGDFRGLSQRLDYLQDLGVTAVWLLPFYPSPLRDDGYDISDYTSVRADSGNLDDFKLFLKAAHQRGLRVITELVINHTSDQHPWFQRARRAPAESRERNFYVWSDTPELYREARVIFQDFEPSNWSWDPIAKAYYWHRFYSHQPDLNFEQPEVRSAVLKALDFWLSMGVDGLRLDAIPYLFERDGTTCENLPETHDFLRALRRHVDERYADRMLLAEANQWPEDAVAYFGAGDECHMSFHFPVMPRLFMALHMEDRFPILDIMQQTPALPDNCQWAVFLRNHDELTLEMVTDEERDYMYRVYANDSQARINLGIRRRLAPLLGRDRRRIELMNALLLSLPGTPVIYYGDEIGMGDNFYLGDRNGVRTPMQWSADRNAGFSRANPQRLYLPVIIDPEYHYESLNVEAQQSNPHSLLWWMKRIIALRKRYRAFGRGTIRFLTPSNRKVLAFVREYEQEQILIVANLSRFVQHVELDLAPFRGRKMVEMFGRTVFPPIGESYYPLTFGPHSFYWFTFETPIAPIQVASPGPADVPQIGVRGGWQNVAGEATRDQLEAAVREFVTRQTWFNPRQLAVLDIGIEDVIEVRNGASDALLLLLRVDLPNSERERYLLPVCFESAATDLPARRVIARLQAEERDKDSDGTAVDGALVDAVEQPALGANLFEIIARRRILKGERGQVVPIQTKAFRTLGLRPGAAAITTPAMGVDAGYFVADGKARLKLCRRLLSGANPEVEIGCELSERGSSAPVARLSAALEYRASKGEPITLGVVNDYIPHEGDAWRYTLDHLKQFFDRALASGAPPQTADLGVPNPVLLLERDVPEIVGATIGGYLETARLLGERTALLHRSLAAVSNDADFVPEPMTTLYQRSLYQSLRNLLAAVIFALRDHHAQLAPRRQRLAEQVTASEKELLAVAHRIVNVKIPGQRIRCHGDLHLGRVLHTGRDLVIVGFAADPSRPLGEQRLKRSPLRDVASLLYSFSFAVDRIKNGPAGMGIIRPEDAATLQPWGRFWERWVAASFLRTYVQSMAGSDLIPQEPEPLDRLLGALLLQRNLVSLQDALLGNVEYAALPLRRLVEMIEPAG